MMFIDIIEAWVAEKQSGAFTTYKNAAHNEPYINLYKGSTRSYSSMLTVWESGKVSCNAEHDREGLKKVEHVALRCADPEYFTMLSHLMETRT